MRDFRAGDRVERELRITGFDGGKDGGFDARVSLASGKLRSFERIQEGQASLNFGDFAKTIELVKADPDWQAAMRKRGIEDFSLVQIDPWPTGSYTPAAAEGSRIIRAISFLRTHREDNGYARPVEGVICFVDLARRRRMAPPCRRARRGGEWDAPGLHPRSPRRAAPAPASGA